MKFFFPFTLCAFCCPVPRNQIYFNNINSIRQGKYFEIETNEKNFENEKVKIEEICKKLLANLIIEEYKIFDNKIK